MMNAFGDDFRSLLEACSFAGRAHDGQVRKDNITPYATHPVRVAFIVRCLFGIDDQRVMTAAILHDTIEDTTTDLDDIVERFGATIASWVARLSKDKRLPDEERENAYIATLKSSGWQVQVCKLADIFDNLIDNPQLAPAGQRRGLRRAEQYFDALQASDAPELQTPIALVRQLIAETRNRLAAGD